MRCIKCLNNLKKCRLISGLCLVLLSLSFCLSGLLSQDVSAVSRFWYALTATSTSGGNYSDSQTSNTWPLVVQHNYSTGQKSISLNFSFGGSGNPPQQVFTAGSVFYYTINISSVLESPSLSLLSLGGITSRESNIVTDDSLVVVDNDNAFYCITNNGLPVGDCTYLSVSSTSISLIHTIKGYFTVPNNWDGKIYFTDRTFINNSVDTARVKYSLNQPILTVYDTPDQQINNSIQEQTQQQEQYHDETQQTFDDAQDTADTDSDSSSQQATSSGTTLLAGFTSFVSALTSASASNCVINADLGNMDLGSIDLCQLSPPPAFQAISSIMVIGFTVPLSIALAKKMISLFRSFQT